MNGHPSVEKTAAFAGMTGYGESRFSATASPLARNAKKNAEAFIPAVQIERPS
jgi:hypothetical protein